MGVISGLAAAAAYLLGSISFAIVVSRAMRLPDPRSYGSGNPGTTNVLRTGHKLAAALTLAGDAGKGWLAVWLAALFAPATIPLAAACVFLGHLFPVFHRFQGGKGVATAAGVLLGIDLWLGLGTIAAWATVALVLRYSSLAALVASAAAPLLAWYLKMALEVIMVVGFMALLLVWRHRDNIARLLAGKEARIGAKPPSPPEDPSAA